VFRGNTAAEEPVGGSKLKTRPHRESGEFCGSRAMDDSSKSRTEQNPPATSMPQPAGWLQHAAAASTPGQVENLPPRWRARIVPNPTSYVLVSTSEYTEGRHAGVGIVSNAKKGS